jgi:hypothetical protein
MDAGKADETLIWRFSFPLSTAGKHSLGRKKAGTGRSQGGLAG